MASIGSISDIRNEILENDTAKRIVIKVRTQRLDSQNYRVSAHEFISEVFPGWENDPRILPVVIDVWDERTFIVVDINHLDYDFNTAHEVKKVFPVYILRQGKKRGWALIKWPREDEPLSAKLMYLHNAHGWDAKTPFLEDHHSRIVHANPRDLRK
ncbi:uncharacterized protein N7479_000257 [Penicillium vulpinum]|uniref:Uncharacterized protein n=1 Tax=Penicillium vulpinum TaxID=29845 RepID=A0A1V6RNY5_9EURO|nr:uncharacterized protein N7479_000257 [Penicillium vulpinum]KAJ5970339.1 hypothetical protein N7479_000257 [Penicillium vulpinum]OQE03123.1 hypothetical protein PENVUL_c035G06384 [Penicillium vulpinum]